MLAALDVDDLQDGKKREKQELWNLLSFAVATMSGEAWPQMTYSLSASVPFFPWNSPLI